MHGLIICRNCLRVEETLLQFCKISQGINWTWQHWQAKLQYSLAGPWWNSIIKQLNKYVINKFNQITVKVSSTFWKCSHRLQYWSVHKLTKSYCCICVNAEDYWNYWNIKYIIFIHQIVLHCPRTPCYMLVNVFLAFLGSCLFVLATFTRLATSADYASWSLALQWTLCIIQHKWRTF